MLKDLITKNRSYRRFNQSATISTKELNNWIDLARLSASGQNAQPIKYIISNEKVKNEKIFSTLSNKAKLKELLSIPDQFEIINVIVLGQPIEEVVLEEMVGNNFNYWRDAEGVHHVPKRPLNELIWDEQLSMKFE
jgi:hypothetical protein